MVPIRLLVLVERVLPHVPGIGRPDLGVDVQVAVLVVVDEGHAVTFSDVAQPRGHGQVGESPVTVVPEETIRFQTRKLRVSRAEKEVDVTVVVDVGHPGAHAAHRVVELGLPGRIGEGAVPVVSKQAGSVGIDRLQVGDRVGTLQTGQHRRPGTETGGQDVGIGIVVVVEEETDVSGVGGLNDSGLPGHFGEAEVAVVAIEAVGSGSPAVDEQIQVPVPIVVAQRDSDGPEFGRLRQAGLPSHVGERPVAIVSVDLSGRPVPQNPVAHHQVQVSVVVEISPQGHEPGARIGHAGSLRDVVEGAIPPVAEEPVGHGSAPAVETDVDVDRSVVVEVDEIEAVTRWNLRQARPIRDLHEPAPVVAVERNEGVSPAQEQVQIPVSVVVPPSARAVAVPPVDAEFGGHVGELQEGRVRRIDRLPAKWKEQLGRKIDRQIPQTVQDQFEQPLTERIDPNLQSVEKGLAGRGVVSQAKMADSDSAEGFDPLGGRQAPQQRGLIGLDGLRVPAALRLDLAQQYQRRLLVRREWHRLTEHLLQEGGGPIESDHGIMRNPVFTLDVEADPAQSHPLGDVQHKWVGRGLKIHDLPGQLVGAAGIVVGAALSPVDRVLQPKGVEMFGIDGERPVQLTNGVPQRLATLAGVARLVEVDDVGAGELIMQVGVGPVPGKALPELVSGFDRPGLENQGQGFLIFPLADGFLAGRPNFCPVRQQNRERKNGPQSQCREHRRGRGIQHSRWNTSAIFSRVSAMSSSPWTAETYHLPSGRR